MLSADCFTKRPTTWRSSSTPRNRVQHLIKQFLRQAADVVFLRQAGWNGIEGSDIRSGAVEAVSEDGVKGSFTIVRRIGSNNSSELLLCSGARRSKLWISRTTSGVIFVASEKFLPPWTTLIPVR